MMIKCSECGHENQLGAIFCRECGVKLDVETLRPELKDSKRSLNVAGLIRNIIGAAIMVLVVGSLGLMFYPAKVTMPSLSEDEQTAAKEKLKALVARIDDKYGDDKYTFSPAEVTYLVNDVLMEVPEGEEDQAAAYKVEAMVISVDARNVVHIAMRSKLFSIATTFEVSGVFDMDSANFRVTGQKMGHLSIPNALRQKVVSKFTPALDDPQGTIRKILDNASSIVADSGSLEITVKKAEIPE